MSTGRISCPLLRFSRGNGLQLAFSPLHLLQSMKLHASGTRSLRTSLVCQTGQMRLLDTGRYAKQCLAVAAEFGVPAIDLWTKMQQFPGWQEAYLRDDLHLTPEGNKFVFEEVIGRLRESGVSLDTFIADLPLIDEINPVDPLKSFEN